MRYVKVETVLPYNLVKEIQKYIQGEYIYIPCQDETRKKWGEKSGSRERIQNRNENILVKYKKGFNMKDLADEYFLSLDSIKKIIYSSNNKE